jgi:hypothetical protein
MPSLRQLLAMGVAALSLLGGGCTLLKDGACLTSYRIKEAVDDCAESVRNRKWAEQAWKNVRRSCPQVCYSDDYAEGFRDGFSEYLYRGGNGEPPPLPPKHYRCVSYQTPEGYKSIEEWFAGYRHGATAAREGGYRQYVTGPSAVRVPPPIGAPVEVGPVQETLPPVDVGPAQETLPPVDVPREPSAAPPTLPPPSEIPPTHARIIGIHTLPDPPAATGPVPDALPPLDVSPPPARARITGVHSIPDPPDARPEP